MAKANTMASSAFRRTAMTVAAMSISGARTSVRMTIMKDCCTFVTSVVRRVTSEAVENLSTLANEKPCTLRKRPARRFFAKPALASAANHPESAPMERERHAMAIISRPRRKMNETSPLAMPMLMMSAIR